MHFYTLEPDRQKRLYATHNQIYEFRVPHAVFFLLFMLDTPFFPNFVDFFENVLAALGGKHNSEGCINDQS